MENFVTVFDEIKLGFNLMVMLVFIHNQVLYATLWSYVCRHRVINLQNEITKPKA